MVLKHFLHKRALVAAFSVFLAFILQHVIGKTHEGWMIFAAFLVCQTTRGTPLKQALNYLFVLVLIAILLPPYQMQMISWRLYDAVIGALIGVTLSQLILPRQVFSEFSRGLTFLFSSLQEDLKVLLSFLNENQEIKSEKIFICERILGKVDSQYPEWVFEVGFNRALRGGFRFFLLHAEQLAEIMFSLNYLLKRAYDTPAMSDLQGQIMVVMQQNDKMFAALLDYFENKKLPNNLDMDFTSDIALLEEILSKEVPVKLELLDVMPHALVITGVVRDLKDMRNILLSLMMALPEQQTPLQI